MIYRFLGTECEITGLARLREFGASVELPEDLACGLIAPPDNPDKGTPLLPAAEFDAIGFTPDELRRYQWPATHADAPEEFHEKKRAALDALHKFRLRLVAGGPMTGGE